MPSFTSVATDTFTGADASFPANFSNLDNVNGQVEIIGNKFHSPYTVYSGARSNHAGTYTDDQYSQCVISGLTFGASGDAVGVICRASLDVDTARDFYFAYVTDNATPTCTYGKVVNGTVTNFSLDSTATTWANADVIRLYVAGTNIVLQKNGADVLSTTDSALTTGKPGVVAKAGSPDALRGDDWEGGNVTLNTSEQEGARFGVDDGAESAHSWAAAQDVDITAPAGETRTINLIVNTGGTLGAKVFKLQYRKVGAAEWLDIPVQ
jgi:hypothetical protein